MVEIFQRRIKKALASLCDVILDSKCKIVSLVISQFKKSLCLGRLVLEASAKVEPGYCRCTVKAVSAKLEDLQTLAVARTNAYRRWRSASDDRMHGCRVADSH